MLLCTVHKAALNVLVLLLDYYCIIFSKKGWSSPCIRRIFI